MGNSLAKNARTIEAVRPGDKQTNYSIKGEPGLRLIVYHSGRKSWFAVYQVGKGPHRNRRMKELGARTLAEACQENDAIQATAANGDDPKPLVAPVSEGLSFGELFEAWLDGHAKHKLNTWEDEQRRYRLHLQRPLATKPIDTIERKDIRAIRDQVSEKAGPIQSNRTLALFNRVLNWAVDEDRAKFNPASRLRKVGEESRRERVLAEDELRRIWHELSSPLEVDHDKGGLTETDLQAAIAVRRAIKLLIITGQRRGEVIGIERSELDGAWWTIPKGRTKNGLPHRVPLTPLALAVIAEAKNDSPYLFPSGKTEGAIRPDAVTKQLQRMCKRMDPKIEGVGPRYCPSVEDKVNVRRFIGRPW
jgi:integrase